RAQRGKYFGKSERRNGEKPSRCHASVAELSRFRRDSGGFPAKSDARAGLRQSKPHGTIPWATAAAHDSSINMCSARLELFPLVRQTCLYRAIIRAVFALDPDKIEDVAIQAFVFAQVWESPFHGPLQLFVAGIQFAKALHNVGQLGTAVDQFMYDFILH